MRPLESVTTTPSLVSSTSRASVWLSTLALVADSTARTRTSKRMPSPVRNGVATTLALVVVPCSRARISVASPVPRAALSNSFTAPRE